MKLTEGIAFVLVHKDGKRELHAFVENGSLSVPETVTTIYQVGAQPSVVYGGLGPRGASSYFGPLTIGASGGSGSSKLGA